MTHADRTYLNLMIFKILTSSKARLSVKHIHAQIEPNMGISVRSLQRYLNGLAKWGLVTADGQTPQGFKLSANAKAIFQDLANGAAA